MSLRALALSGRLSSPNVRGGRIETRRRSGRSSLLVIGGLLPTGTLRSRREENSPRNDTWHEEIAPKGCNDTKKEIDEC